MAAALPIVVAAGVLVLGAGVLVFTQHVDAEARRLQALRAAVVTAHEETARLRAELAYHQRPAYLLGFADALGLVPARPAQLVDLETLAARPAGGDAREQVIALPSGALTTLRRRPATPILVGLAP